MKYKIYFSNMLPYIFIVSDKNNLNDKILIWFRFLRNFKCHSGCVSQVNEFGLPIIILRGKCSNHLSKCYNLSSEYSSKRIKMRYWNPHEFSTKCFKKLISETLSVNFCSLSVHLQYILQFLLMIFINRFLKS